VEINDAVKSIVAILKFYPLLYRTEVITEVERVTGWLDARENALHGCNSRTP
jgi:hypothetical protein